MTEKQDTAIWTEKYRPKDFSEIKGQKDIVQRVKAFVAQKNMPHQMYAGPAGVGKSTLAIVVAKKLFGDNWRQNFLELNASDERGIDIVRVKVKDFARTKSIGDVPFKIIFLDECDALTREAQQALRRTMENYTSTCRFILSCNYSSKILDPIQSRCAVFRFKPLDKKDIRDFIIDKLAGSGKEFIFAGSSPGETSNEVINAVMEASGGDMRRVLNILQSCTAIAKNKEITADMIYSMAAVAQPKEVKDILNFAIENKFVEAKDKLLDTMLNHGLSGLDIIKQIQKTILDLDIENRTKMELIEKCGEIEFRMTEGSDEFIQLECLLAQFTLAKK
jgi:replication factor C small subunit